MHTWQNVEIIMVLKCYCPLTFTFNYLSFLLIFPFFSCNFFFNASITRLFLRKYRWPWVVEQDFHQNFLDKSTLHTLHDCAHFFISFMVWTISLMPPAKLSVTIQAVQGRWFHMGGYVQFIYEWVKWSSHKTGLCIHLIKKTSRKSSFQKSLHYRNFSR